MVACGGLRGENVDLAISARVLVNQKISPDEKTLPKSLYKVLAQKAKDKWNKHGRNYDVIGYAFAPCVMTTYGQIHGHLLRLLYVLVKKQAETVHVHKRPFTHIEHLFGLFFAQSRARMGAAVARGMALRAMGCSLMGVSKVFLRHVAPTRYGDQTFAAG